jgi:O-antigen/teichoic acid export membrane protein
MTDALTNSLRGILGGTAIVFLGNAIGMGSNFVTRVIAARYLEPADYGLIVLGVTLLHIASIIVLLGLHKGLAQMLPRNENVEELFTGAFQLSVLLAAAVACLVIWFAQPLSWLFAGSEFEPLLVIFALALPLMVVVELLTGGFRGLAAASYRVLTKDVLFKGLLMVTVAVGVSLGVEPIDIASAWVISLSVATFGGTYLLIRRTSLLSPRSVVGIANTDAVFSLAVFSFPLMISGASWMLMQHVDNALLGIFLSADIIGLYDASYTLATSLLLISSTFSFLFLPIFSKLHAENKDEQMEMFYRIVTKWMTFAAIPLFCFLVLHPETVLLLIYGAEYATGSTALVIVACGFVITIVTGTANESIVALGNSRLILFGNLSALSVNFALNVALIPSYGIVGAAFASLISFASMNLFYAYYLFYRTGIHPIYPSLVRPAVGAGGTFFAVAALLRYMAVLPATLIMGTLISIPVYAGLLLLLGGVDSEEIDMLHAINEESDVDLRSLIATLQRFSE